MQAITMGRLDEKKPLKNVFKRISHYIYLFKLYSISIILLLKNNLTTICSEVSKIGMNLSIVYIIYTCTMKEFWKVQKNERRWMNFASLPEIMRDVWLCKTLSEF